MGVDLAGRRKRAIDRYWSVLDALAADVEHSLAVVARQNLATVHNPSWKADGRGPSDAEPRRR